MSIKLIHTAENPNACAEAELLSGFCYGRLNPTGKAFGHKYINDSSKILIDVSKYPAELTADNPIVVTIDFGIVPVESKIIRDITVYDSTNPKAPISQDFVVLPREPLMEKYDKVFHVLLPEKNNFFSSIQAKAITGGVDNKFKFRVVFGPKLPAIAYTNTIYIWIGKYPIKLRCQGFSEGPYVSLSYNVVNFGVQYYGAEAKIVVDMMNHSICDAVFQFDNDNFRSPFKVCPVSGVVPPKKTFKIEIFFRPHKPQAYYKRMYCLLHHQNPQYIDLVGVCVPRPFFFDKPVDFCVSSADTEFLPFPNPTFDEYFEHNFWGLKASQVDFNFGGVDAGTPLRPKQAHALMPFTLSSILPYEVQVEWVPDPSQAFSVSPPIGFVGPGQATDFLLHFTPGLPDVFYSGQLECYIYPTTVIWPPWHGPPWSYAMQLAAKLNASKKIEEASEQQASFESKSQEAPEKSADKNRVQQTSDDLPQKHDKSGRIPFELFIFNGDASVKLSITAEKHNEAMQLEEERPTLPSPYELCKALTQSEEEEVEEEEDEEEMESKSVTINEDLDSGKKSKKSKKKKKKSKKGKKDKKKKKTKSKSNESTKSKKDKKAKKSKSKSKKKKDKKKSKKKKGKKGKSKTPTELSASENEDELEFDAYEDEFEGEEENWNTVEEVPLPQLAKRPSKFDIFECKPTAPEEEQQLCTNELAIPLCLSIRVSGHTYDHLKQPPTPHFSIPAKVTMGPTLPLHREIRTVVLKNTSDIPMFFDLRDLGKSPEFDAKPKQGIIPGDGKQIVMISMEASIPYTMAYNHDINVNMNFIDDNAVSLVGFAEVPSLVMSFLSDESGSLCEIVCPTTIPGFATFAEITLKNPSRFHYKFSMAYGDAEDTLARIFAPSPAEGTLAPYDCEKITWKFVPLDLREYKLFWNFRFVVMGAKNEESFWNAVYEIPLVLAGLGAPCELVADPKVLDFDMVQIFDSVTQKFTVTNTGSSVVIANLTIQHEQWLQWFPKEQVTICPTQVHLKSGESIEILATVRPEKPVMYKFFIEYTFEAEETNESGEILVPYEARRLVEIRFMGDHAITQVSELQQLGNHHAWGLDQAWEMFQITKLNQYLKPLTNTAREGSLPFVPTVAFEFPSAPVGSAPTIFSLVLTNLSEHRSFWQIHTQPPKNNKLYQLKQKNKRESFIGSRDSVQDDPSFLTALWTQKYNEINNEFNYQTADESLTLAALKNSDSFRISPTTGTLESYKCHAIVTFKCSYNFVGSFRNPVLLRIYPAIFVWLDIRARCLGRDEGNLQAPVDVDFHPISLSNLDPPIQSVWMYNGSVVSVPFKVDMDPFQKLQGDNYGHDVIECLTPEGVALPKSWTAVKMRFSPIEYIKYKAPLRIRFDNRIIQVDVKSSVAQSEDIDLRPRAKPHQLIISDPFVPVSICPARVILPHFLPTGDRATSLIYITNNSETHSFSFAWPETTHINSAQITFLPDIGILSPREQCACQVIVKAGQVNQVMSTTFRCWIEDVTAIEKYNHEDRLHRGEVIELRDTIIVTKEKGPQKVKKAVSHFLPPVRPQPFSRLLTISCYIGSVFGMLDSIYPNEQAKMSFSDPIGVQPLPTEGQGDGVSPDGRLLVLSPMNRHLAKNVLSQILWDMTMLSSNWPSQVRDITKRHSIYFEDYKNAERSPEIHDELKGAYLLPRKTQEEIMEFSIFNMLQEMADHYSNGRKTWAELGSGAFHFQGS